MTFNDLRAWSRVESSRSKRGVAKINTQTNHVISHFPGSGSLRGDTPTTARRHSLLIFFCTSSRNIVSQNRQALGTQIQKMHTCGSILIMARWNRACRQIFQQERPVGDPPCAPTHLGHASSSVDLQLASQ